MKALKKIFKYRLGTLAFLLLCGCSAYLLYYYFYKVESHANYRNFYSKLNKDNFKLSRLEIFENLKYNHGTAMEDLAIDSAFLRYQVSPKNSFHKHILDYQNGYWIVPNSEFWYLSFSDHAAKWSDQIEAAPVIPKHEILRTDDMIRIRFIENPRTAEIGKAVRVYVANPTEGASDNLIGFSWSGAIEGNLMTTDPRCTTWDLETVTSGTDQVASFTINLFTDPTWMNDIQRVNELAITGTDVQNWQILKITFNYNPKVY